jgi:hypothetical protein
MIRNIFPFSELFYRGAPPRVATARSSLAAVIRNIFPFSELFYRGAPPRGLPPLALRSRR